MREYDGELRSLGEEEAELLARAQDVQAELAELDRAQNLGPVKRARYSQLKQLSAELSETLSFLNARKARIEAEHSEAARRLLALLDPQIARLRVLYQSAPEESEQRVRLFRQYEALVRERHGLQSSLFPAVSNLLLLEVSIEPDDTASDLREKADLVADNVDLIARLLGALGSWKREILEDRNIQAEVRRLQEENDFFLETDPLTPRYVPLAGAQPVVQLPAGLEMFRARLDLPETGTGPIEVEDSDRLIRSIEQLEAELEDNILTMDALRNRIVQEVARREGF